MFVLFCFFSFVIVPSLRFPLLHLVVFFSRLVALSPSRSVHRDRQGDLNDSLPVVSRSGPSSFSSFFSPISSATSFVSSLFNLVCYRPVTGLCVSTSRRPPRTLLVVSVVRAPLLFAPARETFLFVLPDACEDLMLVRKCARAEIALCRFLPYDASALMLMFIRYIFRRVQPHSENAPHSIRLTVANVHDNCPRF